MFYSQWQSMIMAFLSLFKNKNKNKNKNETKQ